MEIDGLPAIIKNVDLRYYFKEISDNSAIFVFK